MVTHLIRKNNIAYKNGDVYALEAFVVNPNEWEEVTEEEYNNYLLLLFWLIFQN